MGFFFELSLARCGSHLPRIVRRRQNVFVADHDERWYVQILQYAGRVRPEHHPADGSPQRCHGVLFRQAPHQRFDIRPLLERRPSQQFGHHLARDASGPFAIDERQHLAALCAPFGRIGRGASVAEDQSLRYLGCAPKHRERCVSAK
jgi:hypothetical protein